jgi:putative ABC transport system ATP-binding protein
MSSSRPVSDSTSSSSETESSKEPIVRCRALAKSYTEGGSRTVVFDDLDLSVEAGEFVVVMGRSGAGKTTLLNLVSGMDEADDGEVWIGSTELTDLDDRARTLFRRRRLGFVFQSFNLISTLTVAENVRLPLELAGGERDATADANAVSELLARVGLADRGDSFPDRLSGGEQQRVAIARALAHDPLLLLTDEPTGNLDYETGRRVLELLTELTRERGKTMLAASHDPMIIEAADRVLELNRGRLVERSPAEVEALFSAGD